MPGPSDIQIITLRMTKTTAITLVACLALVSCAKGEYATITMSYPAQTEDASDRGPWPTLPLRQRISKAFWEVAEKNGYECRAHVKRVEEITCRGPQDLHVTFKPSLNQPEFVAKFNWVDIDGRTPEEFERHISQFASSMTTAVADENLRLVVSD